MKKNNSPTETVRTKYGNCPKCGYEFMGENEARDFGCGMCGYNPPTEIVSDCPKCKGKGFYTIAVSNPNWPSPDTTTVPCDCVFGEHGQELIREGRAMSDFDTRRGI